MESSSSSRIVYLGPSGAGLGFHLSGVTVIACDDAPAMLRELKRLVADGSVGIVLVDEHLAADVYEDIERLNEATLPAIVLIAHPGALLQLSARRIEDLIIRAVGSDVLTK